MNHSLAKEFKCQEIVQYNINQTNKINLQLENDIMIRNLVI